MKEVKLQQRSSFCMYIRTIFFPRFYSSYYLFLLFSLTSRLLAVTVFSVFVYDLYVASPWFFEELKGCASNYCTMLVVSLLTSNLDSMICYISGVGHLGGTFA